MSMHELPIEMPYGASTSTHVLLKLGNRDESRISGGAWAEKHSYPPKIGGLGT
jgi:hypothetical protein